MFFIPPPLCLPLSVEIHRMYDAVYSPSSLEPKVLFRLSPVGSAHIPPSVISEFFPLFFIFAVIEMYWNH